MKVVKVVHNNETASILDIISSINIKFIFESYNLDHYKDRKKAIPIMTRHGTKNVPLVVFENENLDEVDAIWSESAPDWKKEITNKLINE
jgi:hypothetical protein